MLTVRAPLESGKYVLEIDLVQERVCWFAEKASPTAQETIVVAGPAIVQTHAASTSGATSGGSLMRRLFRPLRRGTPTFEMYVVPRADVETVIRASGGELLHAIDDGAAGYRWLSYTYVARRSG
jgi:hypothetical protein